MREGDLVEITIINTLTTDHNFTIENINRVGNEDLTVSVNIAAETTQVLLPPETAASSEYSCLPSCPYGSG